MRAALAAVALVLAGCGVLEREAAPAAVSETRAGPAAQGTNRTNADEIVAYVARLRGMNEAALATEAARQRREASDLARVKAGLALALSAQSDEAEILALVDPLVKKDNGDRDVRAVASFLQVVVNERRRLRESATASAVKQREERRMSEAQKQRADALQQKLDALTDLEKSLSDRPDPNR